MPDPETTNTWVAVPAPNTPGAANLANTEFTLPDDPEPAPPVDPLYERQASLGLHSPSVMLVGCGGVGCWVALALVLGGVNKLTLFDGDEISTHNLNRFPLPEGYVGQPKSLALAQWLLTLRPKAEIEARGEFDSLIHTNYADWIVCATDSLKSRRMCHDHANNPMIRAKYLEVGADGERWTLSPAPPEFSTEAEAAPGYQTVPVHVGPCMMAGSVAAYYVLHNSIPVDSHAARWDGQRVEVRTIAEDGETVTCKCCGTFRVPKHDGLIRMVRHIREVRNVGLAEALQVVRPWFEASPAPTVTEAASTDWTEEQAASHEAWAATEEGQAALRGDPPTMEEVERAVDIIEEEEEGDHGTQG